MKPTIVPFVKWVGGKRKLLSEIKRRLPKEFNNYHEPFLGGGALLFEMQPKKAFISDLNKELINTYKIIRSNPKKLREYLLLMEFGHNVEFVFCDKKNKLIKNSPFYEKIKIIDQNNSFSGRKLGMEDSKELLAARFIYLNKNNFNGIYRVNSQGHYNVPSKHSSSAKTFNWQNIKNASQYLKNVKIKTQSFEKILGQTKRGDFVYLDPPYDFEGSNKSFEAYQKEGFGTKGQIKLAKICEKLDEKGVLFMLSNNKTQLVCYLYRKFNIEEIKVKRLIGGNGDSRREFQEVIITNYSR